MSPNMDAWKDSVRAEVERVRQEATPTTTHNPCCSSHGVNMTCETYRRTHFVEVGPCCEHYRPSAEDVGRNIVNQLADLWHVPVDVRQATNDQTWAFAADLVRSAFPAPPPEPERSAPGVSDAAVAAAERAYEAFGAGMRDALEAAAPLLGHRPQPQPVEELVGVLTDPNWGKPLLDRDAVRDVFVQFWNGVLCNSDVPGWTVQEEAEKALAAVMERARPMPTREQIAQRLFAERIGLESDSEAWAKAPESVRARFLRRADAVLALLNEDRS
jgi:hypothetical protein